MKKLLAITFVVTGLFQGAVAQRSAHASVNEMISDKKFVFIATKVEKRGTYNGSVSLPQDGYATSPAVLGLQYNVNVQPYQSDYLQVINGDGDYFGDYRLRTRRDTPAEYSGESVFLIQNANSILIRQQQAPSTFNEIKDSEFYEYQPEQYLLKSINKNNKKWTLNYEIATGRNTKQLKLEILENGKATLKTLKDKNTTVYLYGYITKPEDVKKL